MATGNAIVAQYPQCLRDEQTQNWKEATSGIAASIAGRAAWLYEHATGGACEAGADPRVPKNPQGLYGPDHAGPPFGSAMRHSLFVWTGALSSSYWTRTNAVNLGVLDNFRATWKARPWVKAFPKHVGLTPYSRAYLDIRAKSDSGTHDVTVKIMANDTPDKEETISVTTTETVFRLDSWCDLVPGLNKIEIELSYAGGNNVLITALSGHQIVKRSH